MCALADLLSYKNALFSILFIIKIYKSGLGEEDVITLAAWVLAALKRHWTPSVRISRDICIAHFCPNSDKLVPSIPVHDYTVVAIGLRKPYAKSEAGTNLVMYDVYRVSMPGIHFQYHDNAQ